MHKRLLCKTICLALLLPSTAKPNETDHPSTPLAEGQAAPFTGILVSPATAASLWEKLEICEKTRLADGQKCDQLMVAEQNRCADTSLAFAERIERYKTDLAQCEIEKTRKWWESPDLMFGSGCAAGGIVGAVAAIGLVWLGAQVRIE